MDLKFGIEGGGNFLKVRVPIQSFEMFDNRDITKEQENYKTIHPSIFIGKYETLIL